MMRKQRGGIVVNITSLLGRIPFPLNSAYSATKFALEGISESIQYELEPFGIKTIIIEPGVVGSNFYKNMKTASAILSSSESKLESTSNSPYSQVKIKLPESSKQMIQNAIHPSEVAKAILEAVTSDNSDLRYVVGQEASKIIGARKNMSDVEFRDLIKKQIGMDKNNLPEPRVTL
jgi:NAD(P)-dependent dehydrogenase (short-subunit alcohol dehydrogenase family)